jgi:hypothetical protein
MAQLLGHLITYRIAMGSQAGRKAFTLQTLPAREPDEFADTPGRVSGFSLRPGQLRLLLRRPLNCLPPLPPQKPGLKSYSQA